MVHIRRQDYLKLGHDLNEEYYINALTKAKSLIKDFHFDVFTDDEEWVKSKLIFHDSKNIYSPKTINENKFQIIDTFSKMLKYQNFIIANSSFSYMAAHLGSTKTSKVLYPKPWFRNKDKNISIDSTWIPIKAV